MPLTDEQIRWRDTTRRGATDKTGWFLVCFYGYFVERGQRLGWENLIWLSNIERKTPINQLNEFVDDDGPQITIINGV